jgi:hypothetical protein
MADDTSRGSGDINGCSGLWNPELCDPRVRNRLRDTDDVHGARIGLAVTDSYNPMLYITVACGARSPAKCFGQNGRGGDWSTWRGRLRQYVDFGLAASAATSFVPGSGHVAVLTIVRPSRCSSRSTAICSRRANPWSPSSRSSAAARPARPRARWPVPAAVAFAILDGDRHALVAVGLTLRSPGRCSIERTCPHLTSALT